MTRPVERCDAVVVGGGPAGLSAAVELKGKGAGKVVLLERELATGGIARHAEHLGYGARDLHRLLTGPAYARVCTDRAERNGVDLRVGHSVTGWAGPLALDVTHTGGVARLEASVIVVATGTRERPRAARLVPGDRPAGVLTTGALQQLVAFKHVSPGTRAIVVGAEHVSFSAVLTLLHAGCAVAAIVTSHPEHQSYAALAALARRRAGAPLLTGREIAAIEGHGRVEAVVLDDGRRIACDTVVFTGDWIPDHELVRRGGFTMAPSGGPSVDMGLRTSRPGVVAAGNLLRGAETADVCAIEGRQAAGTALQFLATGHWRSPGPELVPVAPLVWVSPDRVDPSSWPALGRVGVRVARFVAGAPRLSLLQGDTVVWTGRAHGPLVPNRIAHLAAEALRGIDPDGPPVRVLLADAR